jgi:hypothetical protein
MNPIGTLFPNACITLQQSNEVLIEFWINLREINEYLTSTIKYNLNTFIIFLKNYILKKLKLNIQIKMNNITIYKKYITNNINNSMINVERGFHTAHRR